ncbi:MAG: site-specific recombinase [Candidatus Saccharibacteria bacterium]|nr:site-specific recombinase [Candidatus Saccharibacteria bacterium]
MSVVAYTRVSTDDQVNGTSLDSQRKSCLEYADREKWNLPAENIFQEEGVSAKLAHRPELARLLDFVAKNKGSITHCIVWKVDRLARKSELHHVIKAELAKYGVKLVSVTEPIGDDPMGALFESMLAAFAQFDNEIRLARTTNGMRVRTEQGGWPHDAPVGYRKMRTPSGVTSVEPDEMAPSVKKFLEEFSTGDINVTQAVEIAYGLGIRTKAGKRRSWQTIKNMLMSPLYFGYVSSKYTEQRLIKGVHEAIISEATFYKNQNVLNKKVNNFSRQAVEDWPLRGGFLKHICGGAITGSAPRGNSGPSPRYHCTHCKASDINGPVSKMRNDVHEQFLELCSTIQPDPGVAKLFKEIVLRRWNAEYKELIGHNAKIELEVDALRQKRSRAIDLYLEGKLTDNEKTEKLKEIDSGVATYKGRLMAVAEDVANKEQIIDSALLFITNPGMLWNLGGIEVKKRIQNTLFPNGLKYDFVEGFGTPELTEAFQLINNIAQMDDIVEKNLVAATGIEPVTSSL